MLALSCAQHTYTIRRPMSHLVRFSLAFSVNTRIAFSRGERCWQLANDRFMQNQAAQFQEVSYRAEVCFFE
jgi:hypothetical protein